MENLLEEYARPYDPGVPLVCMDEQPFQFLGHIAEPVPMAPGRPGKEDYEYERKGTGSIFMYVEPLTGWRYAEARPHRTRCDWAHYIDRLVSEFFPDAKKIRLVLDNLNTHTPGSLYEAFAPAKARRLAERLELHYTPKHGSWLNIAEIALSAMTRQCLGRRIESLDALNAQLAAWRMAGGITGKPIDWHFTTDNARCKLKFLYPKL
jgi:hypothetical protein